MMFELAGSMGLDPRPFTLRQLLQMRHGWVEVHWWQTASLLTVLINQARDPKKSKAVTPKDLHPNYAKDGSTRSGIKLTRDKVALLKPFASNKRKKGEANGISRGG